MATSTELKRISRILNWLKTEKVPIDEFTIKTKLQIGASTYQQIKREAKLDPNYNWQIRITSIRGEPDKWQYIASEIKK